MRFKNMNIGKLFEAYVRDDDGELWVNDEQDEALTQEYRMKSLNYLDKREEEFLYHSFFAEMGLSNKFEPGVARIVSDMQFGESMKHMPEIMNLRRIIIILNDIQSECEKYDEDLNGRSYEELAKLYETSLMIQQMRMDRRIITRDYERNPQFVKVEVSSYAQARTFNKYFKKPWELTESEEKFDDYSQDGENTIFFILNKDYKDIDYPGYNEKRQWSPVVDYSVLEMEDEEERLPNYDNYGLSMILVIIDRDGRLLRCTGRYDSEFKYENYLDYLDEEELSLILGVNFYDFFI